MGSLFLRGKTWWIKYYRNGKSFRESSGSNKQMVAKKLLARREGEVAQGKVPGVLFDRVTFDELANEFLRDYKINQKRSLVKAERSVRRLATAFEDMSASHITTPKINAYIQGRLDDGAANATINRELAALKRMFNLGVQQTPPLVDRVPHIKMLEEDNVRTGFFEHDQFLELRDNLPAYLKGVATFGYKSGWRVSEITGLKWSNVDLEKRVVRLDIGTTKNKEGRTIYLDDELLTVFYDQYEKQKTENKILPYVFLNKAGTDKIKDFRGSWKKACKAAGVPGYIFHDLRRTAVRNMVRSGVPERVAMMISGHKTRAVFERYNIVSEDDLMIAAQRQENYLKSRLGTISGTMTKIIKKKASS
jgi:integrase